MCFVCVFAGTSNGMAKSILDLGGEECTPENAAFAIIRGEEFLKAKIYGKRGVVKDT